MPDYPREIFLDDDVEERLASYIETELANHYAERSGHVDDLQRWQKDYWAKPTTEKATFPFTGAATIVIPLSAIAIEAIHSRNMTTRFALPQIVSAKAVDPKWDKVTRPLERFLENELIDQMGFRRKLGDCYLEATKFGTMIGKVGYEKLVKTAIRPSLTTGDDEEFDVTVRDGAVFDPVSDSRFLMPHASQDPQSAQWCGEEHSATPYEIRGFELAGRFREGTIIDDGDSWDERIKDYREVSKLRAWATNSAAGARGQETGRQFEDSQAELENTKPVWPERIDWVELWCVFDVDGSGREKEIVVHFHRPSKTFMSIRYNWHSDLRRPYRTGVYFPIEHRWRGIGICKMNDQFQREVTTQHRQRLDNATLANLRMFKISKLSGYGPKEPVFPGKMWFVDDPSHIDTFQLGEIYPSSYNNEQGTLIYSQQRSGVNEATLGMPQVGTPGTATSDLARIQEGNKKFDFVYANFTEFTNDCINDVVSCIQQFGPRRIEYFDRAEGGQLIRDFFELPDTATRNGVILQLRASGQQQNKILDRQNWQQVAALLNQYFTGIMQLAQPLGNPQIMQIIMMKGMGAATEAMRQILESFDVRNIDQIIVRELEEQIKNGLATVAPQSAGNNGPGGAITNAPMDRIAQTLSIPGGNGNGATNRIPGSV